MTATDPDRLRAALAGVRALILDADGVIILRGVPIPASMAAIRDLGPKGIPFRVVTNFSTLHRETLAAHGLTLKGEELV